MMVLLAGWLRGWFARCCNPPPVLPLTSSVDALAADEEATGATADLVVQLSPRASCEMLSTRRSVGEGKGKDKAVEMV